MRTKTRLKIFTPQGIFYDQEISIVTLKTSQGYIGLQYNRLPFISNIEISTMYIKEEDNSKNKSAAIGGGLVFVEKNNIDIFTDDIQWKENIVKSDVEKIIENITKKINNEKQLETERHKNELLLKKALNKLTTLNKN